MKAVQAKLAGGFTLVELVTVMVLVGVLAAIGIPALMGDNSMAAATFGDEVVSALRSAQKTAVARRRLVCAGVGGNAVILRLAAAPRAGDCGIELAGDGAATSAGGVAATAHILYFQPSGRITSDPAGRNPARGSVTISVRGLERRSIAYEGSTGYVQ